MPDEELAFEAQIKRLYAVLHSLGIDPKDFKKNQNIASFAKLTRKQTSDWITELEQREKENKPKEGATPLDPTKREPIKAIMRESLKDAADLVNIYPWDKDVLIKTRAQTITSIAIALFKERVRETC